MVRALLFAMVTGLFLFTGCGCDKAKETEQAQEQKSTSTTEATPSIVATITTNEAFEKDVLKSTKPVVVKFFATWCGACKEMAGAFDELAKQMVDYSFFAVDIDAAKDLATKYNIKGVPTIVFFKDGNEVDAAKRHVGSASKEHLEKTIKDVFGAPVAPATPAEQPAAK